MQNFVTALSRGLQILRAFTPDRPMLSLHEITTETNLPKSTVLRLLRTLISLNYVRFNDLTKKYYLGMETMSLGYTVLSGLDLRERALPYMEKLADLTQQNVGLGILDGGEVVYAERIKKYRPVSFGVQPGMRINAYRSSMGRAILAFSEEKEVKRFLTVILKEKDAVNMLGRSGKLLQKLLNDVRKKGYALDYEELIPGLAGIAAPILKSKTEVEGAINIVVVTNIVTRKELEGYAPALMEAARAISYYRG